MRAQRPFGDDAFGPEDLRAMMIAFESALLQTERSPELVARKVIEFAIAGERDSSRLRAAVLKSLHVDGAPEDAAA